jgi:hypothetical protein
MAGSNPAVALGWRLELGSSRDSLGARGECQTRCALSYPQCYGPQHACVSASTPHLP